jgi:UDP-N-acetylmuramyl pentapeptide phosphotransferase/UDP-N-acetylglucosamine-1-phosphate transferase
VGASWSVLPVLASAAVTVAVRALPEPRLSGWRRANFRGREVSLSGGLAAALGSLTGAALAPGYRSSALLAGGSALLAGGYDDLFAPSKESAGDKGLSGHLAAVRAGRISGGAVKVALIGTGAVLAAARLPGRSHPQRVLAVVADGVLIAASANLFNLFDLRPGRAGKIAVATSIATVARAGVGSPGAAIATATAIALPGDLGEQTMLGDLGANTIGALLGVRLAAGSRPTKLGALVVIIGLTLASERVSFSKVIESNPVLARLDGLGRLAISSSSTAPTSG